MTDAMRKPGMADLPSDQLVMLTKEPGWASRIRFVNEALLAALTTLFFVLIIVQVFFRYVVNDSLVWSEELVRYTLFYVVVLGLGPVADRGAHMCMDGLDQMVPGRIATLMRSGAVLVSLSFQALLLVYGSQLTLLSWETGSPALETSMAFVYAALPVGALLGIVFTLAALARS
jgi:TRAP-type C4-dicarboxylate transport system permease small subunit